MATDWKGREQRQAPRIHVMTRVKGELTAVGAPILVHDVSRTGFSVVSSLAFERGQTLDFHLEGPDRTDVSVTAEAVHTRPLAGAPHLHLSGFKFVPGRVTGLLPQVSIDRLIAAVAAPESRSFFYREPVAR
jgi:hypothetical protein